MIVSTIPYWFPLLWALIVALTWRFIFKSPINHWLICVLVGAVSFFWFASSFIAVIIAIIVKKGILNSNKNDTTP